MKILLVRCNNKTNINSREVPSVMGNLGFWPPLGLMYIASYLKKFGHGVKLLDSLMLGLNEEQTRKKIIELNPDIVGITVTTPEIQDVLAVAKIAKECNKTVVLGGPHLSIFPKETLSFDFVDYGIKGDGEKPFLELVNYLENKSPNLKDIKGLVYKKEKKIIINGCSIVKDLDELPFPDRSLVPIERYSRADAKFPMATIVSARGCPYNCGFCFRSEEQKVVRYRSPKNVVDEIELLVNKYKIKELIFSNDQMTLNRKHISEICYGILKRKIKVRWQGPARVDCVDESLLKLMKKAGCKQIKFGVESGSQEILDLMNKNITISQIKKAIKITKKAGIRTGAYFIIGYVRENKHTIRQTIDLAKNLNLDFAMFYLATPLPMTSFHELAVKDGIIDSNYWKEYSLNLRHDTLPYMVKGTKWWVAKAYREFYMRPSYLIKKIKDIHAWKALISNPNLIKSLFSAKTKR